MNIYFCAREDLACGTHNRSKPTLTLSCRGYVKSLKHNHCSCAISIFKSILLLVKLSIWIISILLNVIVRITSHLSSISSRVVSSETSPYACLIWFLSFHSTLAVCRVLSLRRARVLLSHCECPSSLRSAQVHSTYLSLTFPIPFQVHVKTSSLDIILSCFDAVPVNHPWYWVVHIVHSLSV